MKKIENYTLAALSFTAASVVAVVFAPLPVGICVALIAQYFSGHFTGRVAELRKAVRS